MFVKQIFPPSLDLLNACHSALPHRLLELFIHNLKDPLDAGLPPGSEPPENRTPKEDCICSQCQGFQDVRPVADAPVEVDLDVLVLRVGTHRLDNLVQDFDRREGCI